VISLIESERRFQLAKEVIPGGVNTSIRAVGKPLVFTKAYGSRIVDADENEYIDYHAAFGPPILGHCHPKVNQRVFEALGTIDLVGAGTTDREIELSRKLVEYVPSADMVQMCNSGSEATFHAIRLSRAVTGRQKIIKFQGCYHGWHDAVLMNIISPPERVGRKDPLSKGMAQEAIENTIVLPFNDLEAVRQTVAQKGEQIAAIILEPIPHNVGCILPKQAFLEGLRRICTEAGIILVFDEVITGFRHDIGGYQKICGVTPDLTTLGKAMANGYPAAAICGRKDLMLHFNTYPGGDVFFAGTYNAHSLATAASLATIEELESGQVHQHIFDLGEQVRKGLAEIIARLGIKAFATGFGSTFVVYFMDPPAEKYADLLANDSEQDLAFRWGMVERGIFIHPMCLKRSHISAAHTQADIDRTLEAAEQSLKALKR